ncbi:DNA-binding SAP [Purpureocillium lavendulum]|uniref:DNA-binding SAP n=1 Tax=Purpureocillium lavendulum TaxID=1247861 RepID=A0AB34FVC2_9HYPO|nr:DNA-binding SAP [Purpureocillium lavendulum]
MPSRYESYHDDPAFYSHGFDYRRSSSRPPRSGERFLQALDRGRVHEAGDIVRSTLVPRGRRHDNNAGKDARTHHARRGRDGIARGEERYSAYDLDTNVRTGSADKREKLDDSQHPHQHPRHHRRRHSTSGPVCGGGFGEAAAAAAVAGLVEAVRARHNPDRSARAVTAAVGAAAVDALVSKGEDRKRGRHIAESAIGGLALDRITNGSSKRAY